MHNQHLSVSCRLALITALLAGRHPRIAADSVRVRFVGYGEWILNVEIFALAETTDFNEFLAIQEDVLLLVKGMVHEAGCDFAFPSQTQYAARPRTGCRLIAARDDLRLQNFAHLRPVFAADHCFR